MGTEWENLGGRGSAGVIAHKPGRLSEGGSQSEGPQGGRCGFSASTFHDPCPFTTLLHHVRCPGQWPRGFDSIHGFRFIRLWGDSSRWKGWRKLGWGIDCLQLPYCRDTISKVLSEHLKRTLRPAPSPGPFQAWSGPCGLSFTLGNSFFIKVSWSEPTWGPAWYSSEPTGLVDAHPVGRGTLLRVHRGWMASSNLYDFYNFLCWYNFTLIEKLLE